MNSAVVEPFWGAQTSYLNFCEEDYVVTRYVAEFVNTLSSLTFVLYGIYGLLDSRHQSGARLVSFCGLMGVGVCSAGYHMTLKYHTQMSDELSMHLLTTPLVYRTLAFKAEPQRKKLIGVVLSALFTIVMVTHMVMDEFLLHAGAFALSIIIIVTRVMKLVAEHVPDALVRERLRTITKFGFSCFVIGYAAWLIDDWACRHLTNVRHSVGLPWAFFLELHGWWHLLTAVGGYIAVAVVDLIASGAIHEDPTDQLAWPVPLAVKLLHNAGKPAKCA